MLCLLSTTTTLAPGKGHRLQRDLMISSWPWPSRLWILIHTRSPTACTVHMRENIWQALFIVLQTGIYSDWASLTEIAALRRLETKRNKGTWLRFGAIYNSTVAISRHESALVHGCWWSDALEPAHTRCALRGSDQTEQNSSLRK